MKAMNLPKATVVLLLILVAVVILVWQEIKKVAARKPDETLIEWLKAMQASLNQTSKTLHQAMSSGNKNLTDTLQRSSLDLNQRLDKAAQLMAQLQKDAGEFAQLSSSMKNLQEYLRSPKLRGNIGEQVLRDLVGQMFPKSSFHLQYAFRSGERVDAAIKTGSGILPVDAKLPAENFQKMMGAENEEERGGFRKLFIRDVRKHLDDIAQKYILPDEGTMDFALMYLPSEPVYYEVANEPELMEHARQRQVYPVSPNTLYAHLQMILLSFEGKEVEKRSRLLFTQLLAIQRDYGKAAESLAVLGKHVNNSYNTMRTVETEFGRLGQKLEATKSLSINVGSEKEKAG